MASLSLSEDPRAVKVMAPAVATERAAVASTLWTATVTTIETPTAVDPPVADPVAVLSVVARCCALTVRPPLPRLVTEPLRLPRYAWLETSDTATAITGVMAVPLLLVTLAPFSAVVVIV